MKKQDVKKLVLAGMLTALGVLLPMLFHTFGIAGNIFLPMHIPVLLCGFLCGWRYGGLSGAAVVLLSSLFTGKPPIYPVGVGMILELAVYGITAALLVKVLPDIVALVGAMLAGRAILGVVNAIVFGFAGNPYSFKVFWTSAFVTPWPGIAIQIVLIPAILLTIKKLSHPQYISAKS